MKKIISAGIVFALVLVLAACGSEKEYTDIERFAARANVCISRNLPEYFSDAAGFSFTTVEFYIAGEAKVIRADCSVRRAGDKYPRCVFMLSDQEQTLLDYLDGYDLLKYDVQQDLVMNLYYVNIFDELKFDAVEANLVDKGNIKELADKYMKSGDKNDTRDKSILGM
ncbi:MAG: hypothetical protein FWG44_08055 [Oscillospiraceae bacterium]|nr:hypothetical protein [Oscillospiraceae bacterium]